MHGLLGMQGEMDGERMGEGELEELEERYWEREREARERRERDGRMHHQEEVEGVGVGVGVSERGGGAGAGGMAGAALSSVPPPPPHRPHHSIRHHQVALCRLRMCVRVCATSLSSLLSPPLLLLSPVALCRLPLLLESVYLLYFALLEHRSAHSG
jgi:hypothetical protein